MVLRGSVRVIIFDSEGTIIEKLTLDQSGTLSGIEIRAKTFHTIFPITNDAIVLQVNEGPFTPTEENDFASWAPREGEKNAMKFLDWLYKAKPGEKYTE